MLPVDSLLSSSLNAISSHTGRFSDDGRKVGARDPEEEKEAGLLWPVSNFCHKAIRISCPSIRLTGKGDSRNIQKESNGHGNNDSLPSMAVSTSTHITHTVCVETTA